MNLVPEIRASLEAKLARLLERPVIARVAEAAADEDDDDAPASFHALVSAVSELGSAPSSAWREDPEDGTCSVRIVIDYEDAWRGYEKEVRDCVKGALDTAVAFLTDEQRALLEKSPRAFLELQPESAELISFEDDNVGGVLRVVALRLASAPEGRAHIRHIVIVPNLIQIERQLAALDCIEQATDDGPLAALRALVGACGASALPSKVEGTDPVSADRTLDEHQVECIRKAVTTPHFAVIEGPPGSGKTSVISAIIRRTLAQGESVLVVSPTHVAVDNVVERLLPRDGDEDALEPSTVPVRYASRPKRLSRKALDYWVGARKQRRGATIAGRVQERLSAKLPLAERLFAIEDTTATGHAPISSAVAAIDSVICGTPIGILSYERVKHADPGSFGLLIVDEVSKMTLSEFLAVAVKARRWVLIGDPAQLPPYNDCEENAVTLDDVVPPLLELACSVGAVLERARPSARRDERLVVVAADRQCAVRTIQAHVHAVFGENAPTVDVYDDRRTSGIVVCTPYDASDAYEAMSLSIGKEPRLLVERGLAMRADGRRQVKPRDRAQAVLFDTAFSTYHAQPWSARSGQRLRALALRNGLEKSLPSAAAIDALTESGESDMPSARAMSERIAMRFALNALSVFDWLTGIPVEHFDRSPLTELRNLAAAPLTEALEPFCGKLRMQYRMHGSISRVPRELFYFGEALHDGRKSGGGCRVTLMQVAADGDERESNRKEVAAISQLVWRLNADAERRDERPGIMIITPYREQEARLNAALGALGEHDGKRHLDLEVCTLDRCQGREADYVLISLVKSRPSPFLDMPKRWNVALTRAKEGLVIVGDIEAYLDEARTARRELHGNGGGARARRGETRPLMSLLARVIEAYDRHQRGLARAGSR